MRPPSLSESFRRFYRGYSMSEISYNSVFDGVSLLLHASFPDRQVHGGNVKQGIKNGDFNVVMPSAGQIKQLAQRFRRTPTVDVIYYPKAGAAECYDMADRLSILLQDIETPEGDLLHCTSCDWSVADGALHVLVGYTHHIYTPQEQIEMETLEIQQEG